MLHFPTAVGDPVHRTLLAAWRLNTVRAIIKYLHDDLRASWRAVARSLGVTPHAVRWHLQRMQDDGLPCTPAPRRRPRSGAPSALPPHVRKLSEERVEGS